MKYSVVLSALRKSNSLYPLDFEEFALAVGAAPALIAHLPALSYCRWYAGPGMVFGHYPM